MGDITENQEHYSAEFTVEEKFIDNNAQTSPLFLFWRKHSHWSNFRQGIFWGGIFTLAAIVSASLGAALTKITPLDRAMINLVERNQSKFKSSSIESLAPPSLTRPVNVLLVEIEPVINASTPSSKTFIGNSKKILLLQLHPQKHWAKIINIPTDSQVLIPGFGWSTIQDANKYGGISLVSQKVSEMLNGTTIERYIRATPEAFQELSATVGTIEIKESLLCQTGNSDRHSQNFDFHGDCTENSRQIRQQQSFFEAFRQRLHSPEYISALSEIVQTTEKPLESNMSLSEMVAVANFIGELESDNIDVTVPPNYLQPEKAAKRDRFYARVSAFGNYASWNTLNSRNPGALKGLALEREFHPFHNIPIAVQNTTNRPELGMQIIAYLKQHNFQNVYLAEHLPLQLSKTEIILTQKHLQSANYLQNILGLGQLELSGQNNNTGLILRIGEDAQYLTTQDSFIR